MNTALDRVINTVELLEHTLLLLPLDLFLRARQVSQLWRAIVLRSGRFQTLRLEPYIGVSLRLPAECSLSDSVEPRLRADLTLYFDKPLTIRRSPSCLSHPSQLTYKHEAGTSPPDTFPEFHWVGCFRARAFKFNVRNKEMWMTLHPGEPYDMSWAFRSGQRSNPTPSSGNLGMTEVGKSYTLALRPGYTLGSYIGTKDALLAKQDNGNDLKVYKLQKQLPLVGENQLSFVVIP